MYATSVPTETLRVLTSYGYYKEVLEQTISAGTVCQNVQYMSSQYCIHLKRIICDMICENVPNCRFNNYVLAGVLSAYIILSTMISF